MMHLQPAHFGMPFQKLASAFGLHLRQAESNGIERHRRPIMRTDVRHHHTLASLGGSQTPFHRPHPAIQCAFHVPFAPHISLRHFNIGNIHPVIQHKLRHIETGAERIALAYQHRTAHHGIFGKQAEQQAQRTVYPVGITERSPGIRSGTFLFGRTEQEIIIRHRSLFHKRTYQPLRIDFPYRNIAPQQRKEINLHLCRSQPEQGVPTGRNHTQPLHPYGRKRRHPQRSISYPDIVTGRPSRYPLIGDMTQQDAARQKKPCPRKYREQGYPNPKSFQFTVHNFAYCIIAHSHKNIHAKDTSSSGSTQMSAFSFFRNIPVRTRTGLRIPVGTRRLHRRLLVRPVRTRRTHRRLLIGT